MKRGATDAVMVSRGDAKMRRANQEGFGSVRAICSTVSHQTPWPKTKIGNVCDLISGYAFKSSDFGEMGIPVVKIGDITDCYTVNIQNCSRIPTDKLPSQYARFRLNAGDIVVAMTGATAGKMGRISFRKHTETALLNQRVLKVIPRSVDARFFWATISNNAYRKRFYELGIGAAQPNFSSEQFADVEIPIPPLPVQRRIADILSAYDDLIENNRRRVAILEETARLAYRKWFGEEVGRTATLGEIAEVVMGQSPESKTYNSQGEGLPFHQGVTGFGFRYPSNEMWCTAGTRFAEDGDILFSVRAPVGRINVASERIVIGRGLSAMRARNKCQSWLLYTLKQYFSKEDMIGVGCIFASTTKKELLSVELPFPSEEEILAFERFASPIDSQIKMLSKQSAALVTARDMLLPRLMKGDVA